MIEKKDTAETAQPTVFVIDDDPSVRKSMGRLLSVMGFTSEEFASAEEFLMRSRYDGAGCLVVDIRMPGLTGLDLQDKLNEEECSIPIIFITGHGEVGISVRAMKNGAVDFLEKPFDDEDLLLAVRRALEKDRNNRVASAEAAGARRLVKLLTPREREVLACVISGMPNKQAAFMLKIAEKTVKIHRGRIMEKLHAKSIVDLVHLAEKAQLRSGGNGTE